VNIPANSQLLMRWVPRSASLPRMRPRAARFAEQWLYENVVDAKGGPVSASELADQLILAGAYADIPAEEFEDDYNRVFDMVFAELERKSAK